LNEAMLKVLASYLAAVWRFKPGQTLLAAGLMLLRSLSEGFGLVLILPLLALLGFGGTGGSGRVLGGGDSYLPAFAQDWLSSLTLTGVLLLFLLAMLVRAAIGFVQQQVSARLQGEFLYHVRVRAHRASLAAAWPHLALQDASRINHSLSVHAEQSGYGVVVLARMVSAFTIAVVSLLVAAAIELQLTLIVSGLALLVAIPVLAFDMKLLQLSRRHAGQLEDLFAAFARELDDLKAAKVANAGQGRQQLFEELAGKYRDTGLSRARAASSIGLFHEVAGACLLIGLVYLATQYQSTLQAGPVAVALIFIRLFPAVRSLQSSLREMLYVLPAWQRLSGLTEAMMQQRDSAADGTEPAPAFRREIQLRDVSFAYPGTAEPVLDKVNITIQEGRATVVAGLSGAGKTTLLDLVSGLLTPGAGQILVDGVALDDENRAAWCAQVAYVVQDAQLSNGTVRDNVTRFAASGIADELVWQALEQAGADDFVKRLPAGLDEQLGDRGQRLSRGQRQRIALARALVQRPKLLLLDEATSALNPRDEEKVTANLQSLLPGCTMLIVAHKLDNLGWCEHRYEVLEGQLLPSAG
jgi:ATP-binding cassette, subfamily C, bacterial